MRKLNLQTGILSIIILLAAFTRIMPHPPNFSPMAAIGLFGAAHFAKKWQAFFIPLIAAMGGNVGVQSSAIIVQGLASNNLGVDNWSKRFMKEFGVASINGIICCVLVFFVCALLYPQPNIALTVSVSLLTVMIFAALFGTFIPLILDKYKVDPALATGPFITTINDVVGLFIYFSIAKLIL